MSNLPSQQRLVCIAAQDVVAKGQKFFFYKRPGQRVLISSQGYMLVRYSYSVSSHAHLTSTLASFARQPHELSAFAEPCRCCNINHASDRDLAGGLHYPWRS